MISIAFFLIYASVAFGQVALPDSLTLMMDSGDPKRVAQAKHLAFFEYFRAGSNADLALALKCAEEARAYFLQAGDSFNVASANFNLGTYYDLVGDERHKAVEYFKQAYVFSSLGGHPYSAAMSANAAGVAYAKMDSLVWAKKYFDLMLLQTRKLEPKYDLVKGVGKMNLAKYVFLAEGRKDSAQVYIDDALTVIRRFESFRGVLIDALRIAADIANAQNQSRRALAILAELDTLVEPHMLQARMECESKRALAHEKLGNFQQAYAALQNAHRIFGEIKSEEGTRKLKEAEAKLNLAEVQLKVSRLQSESRLKSIYLLITALAITVLVVIGVRVRLRLRLAIQEKKLIAQNAEHERLKADEERLRTKALAEAERLRNELARHALAEKIVEAGHKLVVQKINAGIIKEKVQSIKTQKDVRVIQTLLDEQGEGSWREFKEYFDLVHVGFFDRLKAFAKGITPTEAKIAALIRMQKTSKEMAQALNVSDYAIKKSRYRLKKRLGIDKEESLVKIIESI